MVQSTLVVIGLDHHAPLAVRERYRLSEAGQYEALHALARADGIEEAVVLTTPERTEFILWAADPAAASNSVLTFLAQDYGLKLAEWQHFYRLLDVVAITHLFRITAAAVAAPDAGLHAAWARARKANACGRFLDSVLQRALATARRVRHEGGRPAETEKLITAEAQAFARALAAERSVPAMVSLRTRLEEICEDEQERYERDCGPLTREAHHAAQTLTARIVERLAGVFARELKDGEGSARRQLADTVERIFETETAERVR